MFFLNAGYRTFSALRSTLFNKTEQNGKYQSIFTLIWHKIKQISWYNISEMLTSTKFRTVAFNCPIQLSVETKLKRNKSRQYNQKPSFPFLICLVSFWSSSVPFRRAHCIRPLLSFPLSQITSFGSTAAQTSCWSGCPSQPLPYYQKIHLHHPFAYKGLWVP